MSLSPHLEQLEAEAIYVLREVAAHFERPVMLYSAGKDSTVLLHAARKAFFPAAIPFPVLHIDTGYKFPEMYAFRDKLVAEAGAKLVVYRNEKAIAEGAHPEKIGTQQCCALLKTQGLLDALRAGEHDAAIGGARRDEERSRAKERFFSFRNEFGQWDPRAQRPELWSLLNGKILKGQSVRVFPLSNWTELDIWQYIAAEELEISELYFAVEREVVTRREGVFTTDPSVRVKGSETVTTAACRFRSLGCMPCTGAVFSKASSLDEIVTELIQVRTSERATRVIDHDSDGSMEKKKREGYF